MSGHSHYATIKRQKGLKDAAKGQMFSKLARTIQIAAKTGGSSDPESNYKLRMVIESARSANMPKDSIERAISKGAAEGVVYEEVTYEGYGPGGIAVLVEAATDNRNRTSQEIKNIFERGGGSMAGPGSVSYNFEPRGLMIVKKEVDKDKQMLTLIDLGAEEIEETEDELEVYTKPSELGKIRDKLKSVNYEVRSIQIIKKPKNYLLVSDKQLTQKVVNFLETLENHDDIDRVYSNVDISDEIIDTLEK